MNQPQGMSKGQTKITLSAVDFGLWLCLWLGDYDVTMTLTPHYGKTMPLTPTLTAYSNIN